MLPQQCSSSRLRLRGSYLGQFASVLLHTLLLAVAAAGSAGGLKWNATSSIDTTSGPCNGLIRPRQ